MSGTVAQLIVWISRKTDWATSIASKRSPLYFIHEPTKDATRDSTWGATRTNTQATIQDLCARKPLTIGAQEE